MDEHDARREERDRAFELLYRRHRVDVYRAAMRRTHDHHEAEDVTQAAFLDAYRAVLRGTQPELPRAWLLAIAENVRRRRFAASLRRPRPAPLADDLSARSPSTSEADEILAALAALPESQRSAFVLRELAGLSYPEIASRLEVSLPAVQMLLFRARQGLRALLAPPDGKPFSLLVPPWLAGLATRFEGLSVGARSLGALGTGVVILAGVGAAAADPDPHPRFVPQPPRGAAPAIPTAPAARVSAASRQPAARQVAKKPVAAPRSRIAPIPAPARGRSWPAAPPAPSGTPVVDAGPAAPSTAAPAAASGSGGRPAPALVPVLTTLGSAELSVPVSVPQPVPVPVIEPPSVEGAEVPVLELPVVPVLPVEVGGALPVLPGS